MRMSIAFFLEDNHLFLNFNDYNPQKFNMPYQKTKKSSFQEVFAYSYINIIPLTIPTEKAYLHFWIKILWDERPDFIKTFLEQRHQNISL